MDAANGVSGSALGNRSHRGLVWVGLGVIVLVGLLLRVYQLPNESAWADELYAVRPLGAPTLAEYIRLERAGDTPMTPVYFTLAYYWSRLSSETVLSMRILSVLFGMLSLPLTFLVGRRLYGTHAGLIAALAHALSLTHIYQSQEIRTYGLATLLALVSAYALLEALRTEKAGWWVVNVLANGMLLFTHGFTALFCFAQWCFLLGFRRKPFGWLVLWGLVHVAYVIALHLWLSTVDVKDIDTVLGWIPKPGWREIAVMLVVFTGGRAHHENPASHLPSGVSLDTVLTALVGLILAWFVLNTLRGPAGDRAEPLGQAPWPRREALGLLLCWFAIPVVLLFVLAHVWRPCFIYRYILFSSLPIYVLLAGALVSMRPGKTRIGLAAVLLVIIAHQLTGVFAGPFRPDWQSASRYLEANVEPADHIVLPGIDLEALVYNSSIPRERMDFVPVWSEVISRVQEAHADGCDAWYAVWLWASPEKVENDLRLRGLRFTARDFGGWPNLRVYHIRRPGRS